MTNMDSINEVFQNSVKQFPNRTALVFKDEKYTFLELDQLVEKTAAYFYSKGLRKPERIIIYLPHMTEWIVIWLAMQRIGVVPIPVTHFYGHEQLSYIAKTVRQNHFLHEQEPGQLKQQLSALLKVLLLLGMNLLKSRQQIVI